MNVPYRFHTLDTITCRSKNCELILPQMRFKLPKVRYILSDFEISIIDIRDRIEGG